MDKNYRDLFIKKASKKYSNKFDYSKFNYVSAKISSIIICPIHGEFELSPDNHLKSKHGCKECFNDYRKIVKKGKSYEKEPKITKNDYLNRLKQKYRTEFDFDLDSYKNINKGEVILNCNKHGKSTYSPMALLVSTYGCKHCANEIRQKSKTKSYESFVEESNTVHNNKYTYPESNKSTFENRNSIINVMCKKHGLFEKRAIKHLSGQGCFKCRIDELIEENSLTGGYNEGVFNKNKKLKESMGFIYYIEINNGEYYKVGITRNLSNRLRSIKSESKMKIKLIDSLKINLYEAYKLEQYILNTYKECRISLDWSTELFNRNVLNENKLNLILNKNKNSY